MNLVLSSLKTLQYKNTLDMAINTYKNVKLLHFELAIV